MTLGDMIRSKREEHDMTQQELADILHVTSPDSEPLGEWQLMPGSDFVQKDCGYL